VGDRDAAADEHVCVLASHPDHCALCLGRRRLDVRPHAADVALVTIPCPHCSSERPIPLRLFYG